MCIFTHLCFMLIFMLLEIKPMIIVNVVSIIVYLLLNKLWIRKKSTLVSFLIYIEVVVHTILATIMVGWNYGFSLYIICLIPVIIYWRTIKTYYMFYYGVLTMTVFIGLKVYSYFNTSIYDLPIGTEQLIIYVFNCFISLMIITMLCILFVREIVASEKLLKENNRQLNDLASIDPLTKLLNRRSMKVNMKKALKERDEIGQSFSIAICDIDNFKKFNDIYGHDCGDFVLKKVASTIKDSLGEDDSVARWGGEEILILIRKSDIEKAKDLIEKICYSIENTVMIYNDIRLNVTVTFGVSFSEDNTTTGEMILKADKLLYRGKGLGKNRVVY